MIRRLPNLVIHKKPWKILEVPAGAETNNPELIGLFALRVTIVYLFPQKARLVKQVHFLQRWERSLSNNEVLALHPQSWQNFLEMMVNTYAIAPSKGTCLIIFVHPLDQSI
jgi:hypothetical protein